MGEGGEVGTEREFDEELIIWRRCRKNRRGRESEGSNGGERCRHVVSWRTTEE